MAWMIPALASLVLGFAGLAVVSWGWFLWLPFLGQIRDDYGRTWQTVAFAAFTALSIAIAWGLFQVQVHISRRYNPHGRALPDILYCQRCGAPARSDAYVCAACGSTRLGSRRVAGASRAR